MVTAQYRDTAAVSCHSGLGKHTSFLLKRFDDVICTAGLPDVPRLAQDASDLFSICDRGYMFSDTSESVECGHQISPDDDNRRLHKIIPPLEYYLSSLWTFPGSFLE